VRIETQEEHRAYEMSDSLSYDEWKHMDNDGVRHLLSAFVGDEVAWSELLPHHKLKHLKLSGAQVQNARAIIADYDKYTPKDSPTITSSRLANELKEKQANLRASDAALAAQMGSHTAQKGALPLTEPELLSMKRGALLATLRHADFLVGPFEYYHIEKLRSLMRRLHTDADRAFARERFEEYARPPKMDYYDDDVYGRVHRDGKAQIPEWLLKLRVLDERDAVNEIRSLKSHIEDQRKYKLEIQSIMRLLSSDGPVNQERAPGSTHAYLWYDKPRSYIGERLRELRLLVHAHDESEREKSERRHAAAAIDASIDAPRFISREMLPVVSDPYASLRDARSDYIRLEIHIKVLTDAMDELREDIQKPGRSSYIKDAMIDTYISGKKTIREERAKQAALIVS
jgi:hypothetical protein